MQIDGMASGLTLRRLGRFQSTPWALVTFTIFPISRTPGNTKKMDAVAAPSLNTSKATQQRFVNAVRTLADVPTASVLSVRVAGDSPGNA